MQGDNILTILARFPSTFSLVINLDEDKKLDRQRMVLIRNLITHNGSIVNTIYLNAVNKFKIQGNTYQISDSVLPNLEAEVNNLRSVLGGLAEQIKQDLTNENNLKKLESQNK